MSIDALDDQSNFDPQAWSHFEELRSEVERRITELLCEGGPFSEQLALKLAWLGSTPEQRPLLEKQIAHLIRLSDGTIQPASWKKFKGGCKHAWDKTCEVASRTCEAVADFCVEHKKEILTGLAIAAGVTATTLIIIYSGGTAAGPAISLGASLINDLANNDSKEKPLPTPPSRLSLPDTSFPPIQIDHPIVSQPTTLAIDQLYPNHPPEIPPLEHPKPIPKAKASFDTELPAFDPIPFDPTLKYFPEQHLHEPRPYPLLQQPDHLNQTPPPSFTFDPEYGLRRIAWEPTSTSKNFEIPGKHLTRGRIGGIAGINTSQTQNEIYAKTISSLAEHQHIDWTYNATHTFPVDLGESVLLNYNGYSAPAKLLIESWTKFANEHQNDPSAKYLQICHSQGAIHVRNALIKCPEELRQRIIVLAIAPGEVVPKALCYDSFNYASKRDPIPYGKLVTQAFFAPDDDERALQNLKNLEELIILEPHKDAPLLDHGFDSPTFEEPKQRHIKIYAKEFEK